MNLMLYITTVLIWGSTWFAIHLQLGNVPALWSIVYRFGFAAIILWLYCVIVRKNMRFSPSEHAWLFLQGIFLFSGNYILFYLGSAYLNSGLTALIFASIVIFNIVNTRIFQQQPIQRPVLIGALIGLVGLVTVFSAVLKQESLVFNWHQPIAWGTLLCFSATLMASLGSIISARNQRKKLPLIQGTAYAMIYGVLITMVFAVMTHQKLTFSWQPAYLVSLAYLSIFGTLIAFVAYLQLIGRIGADRAGYAFVFTPIVATVISTLFEHFQWTFSVSFGIVLALVGNYFVLARTAHAKKLRTAQS